MEATYQLAAEGMGIPIAVLSALPHPVLVISGDGRFEFANASAEVFFQSSLSVLKKRFLFDYLPKASPLRSLVEQVQMQGSPISEYRLDVSSPRLGEEKWVDVDVTPLSDQSDKVVVMMQVRSMAETLDRQLTHRGAARTVTGLASMLGHEIKNPLSGIRGAAQLLELACNDDDRALTKLITDETDRIVRLVDRMEVFSDERPIERDPINVHSVLEHVKSIARNGFAKDVKFVERYDPSLPPILANRDQLIQVFLNLVKNACEAMAGQSEQVLTLTTAYRPGMSVAAPGTRERVSLPIAITVSDTGPGVPEDIKNYLFDPFVTTKQNGSGLGLALVAKIIGDHGGVISCDLQVNTTAFQVLMPTWSENKKRNGDLNA